MEAKPSYRLNPLNSFRGRKGPLLLIIMDGIGLGNPTDANAVHLADMPFLKNLMHTPLYRSLKAHGKAVGMPSDDDMGNSEVGHNTLGAGRIFPQGASLVETAIHNGSLFGKTWHHLINNTHTHASTLHIIGLLSDGNVHAHIRHMFALLSQAHADGVQHIRLHVLLDGRDVAQKSALTYLDQLTQELSTYPSRDYAIASGGGRMVTTMDRYQADWSIVQRGWQAHVLGDARFFSSAQEAVQTYYDEDPSITDQYLPSFVIAKDNQPIGKIVDHDSVLISNFRGDRVIELSTAFEQETFPHFDRQYHPNVVFAGMTQYDGDTHIPSHFLVNPPAIEGCLSDYLCATHLRSFAISETQKYGHVTYFWNGNRSGYVNEHLETYIEIPSDRVPFDQLPDMKAYEITSQTIEQLQSGHYAFGRVNFPNGDMVGHTGNMDATIRACETTDRCVKALVDTVVQLEGIAVILADHGNADEMFTYKDPLRLPKTSHTLNPVPLAIVDSGYRQEYTLTDLPDAGLSNIASTLCNLLGYQAPPMYDPSLIRFI